MWPLPLALRQRIGSVLVLLQFGLLVGLAVLAAAPLLHGEIPWASGLLMLGSAALGGWTLLHNRLGNFNIHPAPKADGVLVTAGPYQLMRHPMYTSVLLGAAALANVPALWTGWLLWAALALVLLLKSGLEEQWLRSHHAGYSAYCKACKRFVPWVF
jgi:protein-S-isoprenylcysteine O-methyltransferase Ste14